MFKLAVIVCQVVASGPVCTPHDYPKPLIEVECSARGQVFAAQTTDAFEGAGIYGTVIWACVPWTETPA